MKAKVLSLCIALLVGVSAWADDVWNYNVYDDCSKNGYKAGYVPAPADVQAVDLGLPSGIKWASCNVGAEKPEDYGNYYAWGEVLPKEDYSWATYKYANGDEDKLTKYCNNASYGDNGFTDNKTTLEPEDDAAHVNWGGSWRMPNDAEWTELLDNCTWTWTTLNDTNGYIVTSKVNDNSIFLPAAGCRYDYVLHATGTMGLYFSSSLYTTYYALSSYFDSTGVYRDHDFRRTGRTIRPVYQSTSIPKTFVTITLYADGCGSANTIRCDAGQQINITAVPENAHRHFVRWTDGNTDNPRLVTVTKDMTFTAEFALITSGKCGDNLYWKYVNHTLTISGTGNMYDYNDYDMPWLLFRDTTDVVILERGVTGIGNNAFNGFVKLGKIEFPSTLSSIGANAFAGCRKLYDIYSYAVEPPVADNTSFANYNVYLHVPCDNLRDYQMDAVFGSFKYIQCMSTTDTEQVQTNITTDHAAEKVFRDGQVFILRGSKTYTLTGEEVE